MSSNSQIHKAIFIILFFAVFAWLTMVASDASEAKTGDTAYANAVPGSSLEGINEPLQKIIDDAKAAEQQRAAANPDCVAAETALRLVGATDSEIAFALPIARRESRCTLNAVNHNHDTKDDSWGPWQINYYGDLYAGRVAMLGTPDTNTSSWERAAQNFLTLLRSSGRCHWIPPNYCAG